MNITRNPLGAAVLLFVLAACGGGGKSAVMDAPPANVPEQRVRVVDGDTIDIDDQRYRLSGFDAPERHQKCRDSSDHEWACGQAATVIARAMGFKASSPPLPDGGDSDWLGDGEESVPSPGSNSSATGEGDVEAGEAARNQDVDWLGGETAEPDADSPVKDTGESSKGFGLSWF